MGGIEKVLLFIYMYRHQFDFATIFFGKGKFYEICKFFGIILRHKKPHALFYTCGFLNYIF